MTKPFDRRQILATIAAAGALAVLPAAAVAEPVMGDVVLGDEAAPVTVIEYASFTCPHCASFHLKTWPRFKAEYVDTGKVRFILREVYFDRYGLWASMVARCGGANAFYPMAEQYMKQQNQWARGAPEQIGAEIQKIGRINGLSSEQLSGCLSDQDYAKELIKIYQDNATADEVTSTPTFVVNGEKASGNLPFEDLAAMVDAHL
jgi:protein-disulfide isomerase